MTTADRGKVAPVFAWYTLGVLVVVTLFAFVDRQVLQLLAEQIKHSLSLSDLELGLLQGTGGAIFSAVAAYPLSWLSDRFDRRMVLVGSILVWSLSVVACGLANSFLTMLIASSMVAAGEAGLAPLTYAVIPDLFESRKRQFANSLFALVSSATGSIALAAGGQMIAGVDSASHDLPASLAHLDQWRLSFFAAAIPAPLMMLLVLTTAINRRTPVVRPSADPAPLPSATTGGTLWSFFRENAVLVSTLFGAFGIANFGCSAFLTWMVVICLRVYGQTAAQVGSTLGLVVLAATPVGFIGSLLISKFIIARRGVGMIPVVIGLGYLITAAAFGVLATVPPLPLFYAVMFLGYSLNISSGMILPTALQEMTPEPLRARMFATNLIVNVAFVLWAAPLVGFMSDRYLHGPHGLLQSAVMIAAPSLCVAAFLISTARKRFEAAVKAIEA